MIIMVTEKIRQPTDLSLEVLLSPDSSLNPGFFAYGNLPVYLLKTISWFFNLAFGNQWLSHQSLTLLGRIVSAIFDLGVCFGIYKIGQKLFSTQTGLWSAFLYATSVLPIQLSHFYAVDTLLNFFILTTLFCLIRFQEKPGFKKAVSISLFFGFSLATKISALALLAPLGITLLIFLKRDPSRFWLQFLGYGVFIFCFTLIIFFVTQPYIIIDWTNFLNQVRQQQQMTRDPFIFPYTLQYVATSPYFYYLKNLLFWGLGIGLGSLSLLGLGEYLINFCRRSLKKDGTDPIAKEMIILTFFLGYFFSVGCFAVKFMRYFLPLYPLFCLYAARFFFKIRVRIRPRFFFALAFLIISFHLGWLLAFMRIYQKPHSRTIASRWINQNIPPKSVLATEHWDDSLPLFGRENYRFVEMPMYEPDILESKWQKISQNLEQADYLILSSNRLWLPLQRLAECGKYKVCYPRTARYYQDLFHGRLGFQKIAEFTSYPGFKIGSREIKIKDSSADESFTVYDHPQVIIFKKTRELPGQL
ncbi:MAG: glycosyltransferase family 39 protein [Candidatus Pacebacteria bacterium]|nr:glycosyltransferase family 39 protein [Candidatus Paceibacterota bacterium]